MQGNPAAVELPVRVITTSKALRTLLKTSTCSADIAITDEAIQEMKKSFGLRMTYIGGDGKFLHNCDIATVKHVLHNLTGM